LFMI